MNRLLTQRIAACAGSIAGLIGFATFAAAAQPVDFAGKRVEIIVPFAPGGGADTYARAIAPYFEKHLPGSPTVVLRNIPGGGSIPGANEFEARAKPNGLNALAVSSSTVSNFVFQKSKVRFDINKWQPVLLSPQGSVVYVGPSVGVRSAKDIAKLKNQKLTFGGKVPTGAELRMVLATELLGLDVNFVWGVERGEARLAVERGEFNISYDTTPGYNKHVTSLVKSGKAFPLFAFGVLDEKGNLVRDPNFPDLPSFAEVYETMHGKKPSGVPYTAFKSVIQMGIMASKAIVLPSGTPAPLVEAWRTAAKAILADADFQKRAAKIIEGYPQFVGEAARPIFHEATTFSPEVTAWLRNFLKTKLNATM